MSNRERDIRPIVLAFLSGLRSAVESHWTTSTSRATISVGMGRLTSVEKYLASVPGGIRAYPDYLHRGQLLATWLRASPTSSLSDRLPPEAAVLLEKANRMPDWVPTVQANVLYLAIREVQFTDDAAFFAHASACNRAWLETPIIRVFFWVATPRDILRAAGPRWSTVHRGGSINVRIRGDSSAELELGFPPYLFPEIVLLAMRTGFVAVLENAGARNVAIDVRVTEPTRAIFVARWQ
jgi:hypothetical protein